MESRGFIFLKWAADGLLAHDIQLVGFKSLKWAADGLLAHDIELLRLVFSNGLLMGCKPRK